MIFNELRADHRVDQQQPLLQEWFPLAVGTQTNGSVIRPASFLRCVWILSRRLVRFSRHRVLQQSRPLDQVGVFGRSVGDVALIAEALMGFDPDDPDTRPAARPALARIQAEEPPVPPKLAFVKNACLGSGGAFHPRSFC